jgi:hypothetical protein
MFIRNPLVAGLDAFRSRASVPSVGGSNGSGDSVSLALERVALAERNLQAAREAARQAARQAGRSTSALFAECAFIARSTGERWRDDAFSEGQCSGMTLVTDNLLRAQGRDPDEVRAEMAERTKRDRKAADAREVRWNAIMRKAGWHDAVAAGDHRRAGRIMVEMHDALTEADAHVLPRATIRRMEREHGGGGDKADRILSAAKTARMGGPEVPPPERGSFADRVIAAGKKRRNEF